MDRRRAIVVVAVVLMVGLAGCSGLSGPDDGGPDAAAPGADGDMARDDGGASGGNGNGNGAASAEQGVEPLKTQQRQLIRTGTVRLRVNDTETASETIRNMTTDRGGFVTARNRQLRERHNETWTTERVVLRVPSDTFESTVADVQALGAVRNVETSTDDVTEQLVDIEARLSNRRAERDRLRDLYRDANETEDVLAIQRELANVQGEIERLEAKQQALERDVAYATLTIHLEEQPPAGPQPEPEAAWYETGLAAAFLDSVDGVATTGRAIAVGIAYVAPYLVVFGTPLVGVVAAWRRWQA